MILTQPNGHVTTDFDEWLMNDWSKVPVFGERPDFSAWVIRESAYVLVSLDDGCLAIVRTSKGTFLPGGGIESGETPHEAIRREALEECGLSVQPGACVARAIQLVYSVPERTHFEKRSIFCDGLVVGFASTRCEPDHELIWIQPEEAIQTLSHESQQWAVKEWLGRHAILVDMEEAETINHDKSAYEE